MARRSETYRSRASTRSSSAGPWLWLAVSLLVVSPVEGRQVVDTTQAARFMARADSMRAALDAARRDSLSAPADSGGAIESVKAVAPLLDSLRGPQPLFVVSRPVRQARWDLSDLLSAWSGSFLHDFGSDGWPDAWSPEGVDPARVMLTAGGIPFDDPVTGAPAWDLLPLAALGQTGMMGASRARVYSVDADFLPFADVRPLTEARYRSGGGLQAVSVIHAQNRSITLAGKPRPLGFVFGYTGAGSIGEYEGSRMRRKRQLFLRLSTELGRWSLESRLITNRQRVGAHAGVVPPGANYESIYNRLLAGVIDADAVRERYRSDLSVRAAGPLLGRRADVTTYRTQYLLRYVQGGDSTAARVVRYGMDLSLPLLDGPLPLTLQTSLRRDGAAGGNAVSDAYGATIADLSLSGASAPRSLALDYAVGLRSTGRLGASGALAVRWSPGALAVSADVATSPIEPSVIDRFGFGATAPAAPGSDGRISRASLQTGISAGAFSVSTKLFTSRQTGGILWQVGSVGIEAISPVSAVSWTGWAVTAAFRESAERGFHGRVSATLPLRATAPSTLLAAYEGALPTVFADGVFGWRASLFRGDAVVDLRLESRAWSTMRGRRLHTPTGLLVLSDDGSGEVPGSILLDLRADVDVRTATFFVGMENLLSGTQLVVGNQVILDYPYPQQRFRFGVFWPIFD